MHRVRERAGFVRGKAGGNRDTGEGHGLAPDVRLFLFSDVFLLFKKIKL